MEPNPVVITKTYRNVIYYWSEEDRMLMKQVLPTGGLRPVIEVEDPSRIDEMIIKDFKGEWAMREEDLGIL